MAYQKEYQKWLNNNDLEPQLREQLIAMNKKEIIDAFSNSLSFGTAGIRGVIGPGIARMNIYNIRKATIAFIQYLQKNYKMDELQKGIVIAHDNRHYSLEFSQEVANIFTSYSIPVYLFTNNDLRPTPLLSYSVRKLNALAGVVITASHNPPEYNGFKIYDKNGCQFLPVVTDEVSDTMENIAIEDVFKPLKPIQKQLIKTVPIIVEEEYIKDVKALQFYPHEQKNIKIVFSNQHGTSRDWVMNILQSSNYEVIPVKEQWDFDPNFSNTSSPNPEVAESFALAIKYAKKNNANLIIINDPDSDRIGIAVLHHNEYFLLNGNETALILLEYLLSHYQQQKIMPSNPVMYNTFVTGHLSDLVAKSYGCKVIKTLTGFKWIGNEMAKEKTRNINFVFGFEEAYGYVVKDLTRDKDGIAAAMVVAEACNYYLQQNKSLVDVLEDIYQKYGYFYFNTVNVVLKGTSGQKAIKTILAKLRKDSIVSLNNIKLEKKEDYLQGLYNMPPQDLLKFYFSDGSWVAIRASGTEPKIKFYFVCVDKSVKAAKIKMELMFSDLEKNYLHLKKGKLDD
ncbi:phospho-sugar mutase [Spiroplasma endosymbiont of Agriotes lineatus]|uniref:phospho-sugar mutase n=1 Tax=Spiroplasma endosymbiont of Agriotes lineatus TaxID=3077930 RepID=UPI0030CD66DC